MTSFLCLGRTFGTPIAALESTDDGNDVGKYLPPFFTNRYNVATMSAHTAPRCE